MPTSVAGPSIRRRRRAGSPASRHSMSSTSPPGRESSPGCSSGSAIASPPSSRCRRCWRSCSRRCPGCARSREGRRRCRSRTPRPTRSSPHRPTTGSTLRPPCPRSRASSVPGGRLGIVWNLRDESVDWVARLSELIDSGGDKERDDADEIAESALYEQAEEAEWRWEQPLDRARLRDLVLSRSYCATLPPERQQAVLDSVDRLYDELAGPDGLALPYVTYGVRATRR